MMGILLWARDIDDSKMIAKGDDDGDIGSVGDDGGNVPLKPIVGIVSTTSSHFSC